MNSDHMKIILSAVEDAKLPDGAYLEFANVMKKEFDKIDNVKTIRTEEHNLHFKLHGVKCIEIEVMKEYHIEGPVPNIFDYKINGILYEKKQIKLIDILIDIFVSNATHHVEHVYDDFQLSITKDVKEHIKFVVDYTSANRDPDDDEFEPYNYNMRYVIATMLGLMTID